jgi:hypothetical protein
MKKGDNCLLNNQPAKIVRVEHRKDGLRVRVQGDHGMQSFDQVLRSDGKFYWRACGQHYGSLPQLRTTEEIARDRKMAHTALNFLAQVVDANDDNVLFFLARDLHELQERFKKHL